MLFWYEWLDKQSKGDGRGIVQHLVDEGFQWPGKGFPFPE